MKRFENEGSPIAEEMLRQIALLYQIEKSVRSQDAAVRLAARREHADPVITALKPWLEAQLSRIPQKSQLGASSPLSSSTGRVVSLERCCAPARRHKGAESAAHIRRLIRQIRRHWPEHFCGCRP